MHKRALTVVSHLSYSAEACFHRAWEVARAQEARWLELRAAASLGRPWRAQRRGKNARELLAGILG